MMKSLADAESTLKEIEREANYVRSRELRELLRANIEDYREIIKALRKFYH